MKNMNQDENIELSVIMSQSISSTSPQTDKHGKLNSKSQKASVSEESGVLLLEAEAAGDYDLRDSSNRFHKSKKLKVHRLVSERFSTALEWNDYHLVERS